MNSGHIDWKKVAVTTLVGGYLLYCLQHQSTGHIIDSIDLVIHEAGHTVFSLFGTFLHVFGGSLLQILIPIIFSAYFYLRRDYFSVSVVGLWVGYNIINVSVYMADAIAMDLPLLGGDGVLHDWNILFSNAGVLGHSLLIANIVYGLGVMIFAGSWISSFICARGGSRTHTSSLVETGF